MSLISPELEEEFLDEQIVGVLATQAKGGQPRQSVVYYARDGDRLPVSHIEAG